MATDNQQQIIDLLNSTDKLPHEIVVILKRDYGITVTEATVRKSTHNRRLKQSISLKKE
jgi:hypothetical protein